MNPIHESPVASLAAPSLLFRRAGGDRPRGRTFRPASPASARVRRVGDDRSAARVVKVLEVGVLGFEMTAEGLRLEPGERVVIELGGRAPLTAEARVGTVVALGDDGPAGYRCRFVRLAPCGARSLLRLANGDAVAAERACS